jgi:hypothetical protein
MKSTLPAPKASTLTDRAHGARHLPSTPIASLHLGDVGSTEKRSSVAETLRVFDTSLHFLVGNVFLSTNIKSNLDFLKPLGSVGGFFQGSRCCSSGKRSIIQHQWAPRPAAPPASKNTIVLSASFVDPPSRPCAIALTPHLPPFVHAPTCQGCQTDYNWGSHQVGRVLGAGPHRLRIDPTYRGRQRP